MNLATRKKDVDLLKSAYQRYLMSDYTTIYKAYKKPSWKKEKAWEHCQDLCKKYNGTDLKVVGKNDNYFSAGFVGKVDGKKAFVFITVCYNRYLYF